MFKARILVVDDERGMLEVCADTLQRLPDTEIETETRSWRAAERLAAESFDLLVVDRCMPDMDGIELLRHARRHDPNLSVLMLTAFPTVESAIESMKLGAADYITKPFLPEDLLANVQALLESRHLKEENQLLRRQTERTYAFGEIVGTSPAMRAVFETIGRVAETDFDVLIIGETGTGKELAARAIHQHSRRKTGPFVPIDCGAIPDQLMESEFFGHERGAFTGAHSRNLGLLEFASGGTFFLDELSQLPLRLQSKLLRVLQERKIRRVGGTREIDLDVRIVAASSAAMEDEVKRARFRPDLYHRINVVRVELPPLRERIEDIPLLINFFLGRYGKEVGREHAHVSPDAMEILTSYSWPGNVRELQNTLKRALALIRQDEISPDQLPDQIVAAAGCTARRTGGFFQMRERRLAAFEREYFRNLLRSCHGDASAAAKEAQLPRGTLYRLLKKAELNSADFRHEDFAI